MQIGNLRVVANILVPNILILEGNCVWQICIQSRQFYRNSYQFKANLQFKHDRRNHEDRGGLEPPNFKGREAEPP